VTRSVESDYAPNPGTQALKQEAQKLGNFYYQIDGAQSYCSEDKAIQAKTTKMIQDVREAIKGKLELIQ